MKLEDEKVLLRREESKHKRELNTLKISFEREQKLNNELRVKLRDLSRMKDGQPSRSTSRGRNYPSSNRSISPNVNAMRARKTTARTNTNTSRTTSRERSMRSTVTSSGYGSSGSQPRRARGNTASTTRRRSAPAQDGYSSAGSGYDSQGSGYDSRGSRGSRGSARGSVYAPTASSASRQRDKAPRSDSPISSKFKANTTTSRKTNINNRKKFPGRSSSRDSGYSSNDSSGSRNSMKSSEKKKKSINGSIPTRQRMQPTNNMKSDESSPTTSLQKQGNRPPIYGQGKATTTQKNSSPIHYGSSGEKLNMRKDDNVTPLKNRIPLHTVKTSSSPSNKMASSPRVLHDDESSIRMNNENYNVSTSSMVNEEEAINSRVDTLVEPPSLYRQKTHQTKTPIPLKDVSNSNDTALELFEKMSSKDDDNYMQSSSSLKPSPSHEYTTTSKTSVSQDVSSVSKEESSTSLIDNDATAEISDIDRRLNQLQEFLKAAKQTN